MIEENQNGEKKEVKIWNLPNILTFSRVIIIPVFVALFYVHFTGHFFVLWGLFALACITDLFDGAIARKYNLVTNLGKFLDPIADKVLVLTSFVLFLTKQEIFCQYLDSWAIIAAGCGVTVILAREIIVSGFRMVAASSGAVISADRVGKYKTFTQDLSVGILLFAQGLIELLPLHWFSKFANALGLSFFVLAILLTVISGINYIYKNIEVLKK